MFRNIFRFLSDCFTFQSRTQTFLFSLVFHNQGEAGLAGDPGLPGPAGPTVGECGFTLFNPFTSECTRSFKGVLNIFQAIIKKKRAILVLALISSISFLGSCWYGFCMKKREGRECG